MGHCFEQELLETHLCLMDEFSGNEEIRRKRKIEVWLDRLMAMVFAMMILLLKHCSHQNKHGVGLVVTHSHVTFASHISEAML